MKLATLKKDTYFVDRYGEWVAVRAGAVIQVEGPLNGEYMLHAPGGMIESISGGFVNECLEFLDDETSKA